MFLTAHRFKRLFPLVDMNRRKPHAQQSAPLIDPDDGQQSADTENFLEEMRGKAAMVCPQDRRCQHLRLAWRSFRI
jgi:hypothetical protein